ncbi:glutathione metabolism protein [Roseomonas eburnea]|uniref:Glutathione metabolism protein n=1 Tax=Neoroseomonas eburnea TaxID=1346889 RepID=A0A9X9XC06_9PROT|nr:MAPEG family protein [Neoroseomonas eburnea]MBR0681242.1 glutathione metabolism protein [Neoroseomonas eburnea]
MPRVTALYAGLLIALFLGLTFRVFAERTRSRVVLGTGGDRRLERAVRVHANFAEYVPVFLVALLAAELCGAAAWALHAAGLAMLAGRAAHAAGVSREPDILPLRGGGMLLTLGALFGAAGLALGAGLSLW